MKPAIFERSADTQLVIDCLRATNDEVSYVQLAKLTKLPLGRIKTTLASARRALLKESILFGTIRGYGLRRLTDPLTIDKSDANRRKIGRAARRSLRELDTVNAFETLTPRDQLRYTTNRTVFTLTRQQCKAEQAIEPPQKTAPAATPDANTLAVIIGRK